MKRRTLLSNLVPALACAGALAQVGGGARALSRRIPSSGKEIPVVGLGSWITFNVGAAPAVLRRPEGRLRYAGITTSEGRRHGESVSGRGRSGGCHVRKRRSAQGYMPPPGQVRVRHIVCEENVGMATEARHHHYIPQCYLRNFATGSGKRCKLEVSNMRTGATFNTNPRNVAGVRDFNRIEIQGFKPDHLETTLSQFEGQLATAIRNIAETKTFEGQDRAVVLNLIAMMGVRNPFMRENMRDFQERTFKMMMGMTLATKERWESQVRQMKEAGVPVDDSLTYEQLKDFHNRDEYKIDLNQGWQIGLEFKGVEAVLPTLMRRKWTLFTTNEETGPFITGDRPVALAYLNPGEIPPILRGSPGFGMQRTELTFPLTRHIALSGHFEGDDGVMEAVPLIVAAVNTRMIEFCHEQVYSPRRSVLYVGPGAQMFHDNRFPERYKAWWKEMEEKEREARKDEPEVYLAKPPKIQARELNEDPGDSEWPPEPKDGW